MPAASAEKRARQRANKLKSSADTAQAPETDSTPILPTSTPPLPHCQPASTSQDDVCAPAATLLSFSNFIVMATIEDIEKFLAVAATTLENQNLQLLWRRAYKDGYKDARKAALQNLERKMEEKFEEGVERGMDLGRKEGYMVAKEGFDSLLGKIKVREAQKKADTTDSCTQTDPPPTMATVSTQTSSLPTPIIANSLPLPMLTAMSSRVTTDKKITVLAQTMTVAVQTNPIAILSDESIQTDLEPLITTSMCDASSQTTGIPCPGPVPDPIHPTLPSPAPLSLDWADDATSLPTQIPLSPLPPRDLSGLRSSKSNPFSSLQYRSKRFSHYSHQPRRRHSRFNFNSFYSPHRNSFQPSQPYFHSKTHSHLNWESDPRLSDLSRSLKALGWIRAS
jgi:hypothetical protein